MEVKEASARYVHATGYKQTEVGLIPEDWQTPSLENLTVLMTNGFVGTATRHYTSNENGILYIQGYNVEENSFNFHGVKYVTEEFHRAHLKSCLRGGDLLTVQTGDVGLTAIVPESLAGSNCHALIISRFDQKRTFPVFISYYLNSNPGRSRLRLIETGTTMKHLNVGDMLHFVVPLPSTKAEQEAIAEALNDADALIESLEQLLSKKRHLKQGAMHELLTGKKRLPGFSGGWGTLRLRDLLTYERPDEYIVQDSKYTEHGQFPVLTANKSFILGYTDEDFGICREIPVIVFDDFTTDCKYVKYPFKVKSSAIKLLRPKHDRVDLKYVFERMQLIHFPLGGHKRYYISEYQDLELEAPDYDEQQAISAILSDMDAELTALEAKLVKARNIKQGMMQELLTGRIRLV